MQRLSVVVPVYNRGKAAAAAIRSILDQIGSSDEIIVVDDASTLALVSKDLGIDDARVRILRLAANQGASAARQHGIDAATGDVVAFLDSDDAWLPGKLSAQLAILREAGGAPLTAVACGWLACLEDSGFQETRIPLPSDNVEDFASGCWFCPGSTVIVPRAAFKIVGPFDVSLRRLEDLDWFLRFAMAGGKLRVLPEIGARISIGKRGRLPAVRAATDAILRKFSQELGGKQAAVIRRLRAYLALELGVAARNDRKYLLMILFLLRSFWLVPRRQLSLKRWWDREMLTKS